VPRLFISEPAITRALAARYPEHIPSPLATNEREDESWMLLRDLGGHELEEGTIEQWAEVLDFLGRIQRESAGSIHELLAFRCADRRLDKLAAQIDRLVSNNEAMSALEVGRAEQLRAAAPRLKEMCMQLAGYGVPQTLVHGDFHGGNVIVNNGNYIFFDWTDACIAHPFFDLPTLFDWGAPDIMPAERLRLRDRYLRPWSAYEPPERLVEAFELGYILGMLHQVISYQQIVDSLEPTSKRDLQWGIVSWVQKLLEALSSEGDMWTKG
jgi:aminoglycoside phosphotransferase (APT) family kinase protein